MSDRQLTPVRTDSALRVALRSFRGAFIWAGGLSAAANLMLLTPTLYLLHVYDRVLVSRNEFTLMAMSAVALFLLAMMALAEGTRSRLLVHTGLQLDEQVSGQLFDASLRAGLANEPGAGGRAFEDLLHLRQFLTGPGLFALFDAPWTPIYIAVCFLLHPLLGWVALLAALVQGVFAWLAHASTAGPAEAASRADTEAMLFAKAKLRHAEVLEPMGMSGQLRARWFVRDELALQTADQAQARTQSLAAVSRFLRLAQQSLGLGVGALLVIEGELSPATMIASNVLLSRALAPIDQLVASWRSQAAALDAWRRLESLLRVFGARRTRGRREPPQGEVGLRNLGARAPGREEPVLQAIDLTVPAGTTVVVLGPSGSGKSTLLRCVLGIWPQVTGEVLLDDTPPEGWDREALGPHLGYLPQDVQLFEGSIAENIARFGALDAARVVDAARCAQLHEAVLRMPKGYDTPLGDGGRLLSAGLRQRIGLARALYGRPRLVVLDEPNAHLDEAGEAALTAALGQLKAQGSTVFVATQRPGVVAQADWLVLLEAGRLRASGPRAAVLEMMRLQRAAAQAQSAR